MTKPIRYPMRLLDLRSAIQRGDLDTARNILTNQPANWKNWLTPAEIIQLRNAGVGDELLSGPLPPPGRRR